MSINFTAPADMLVKSQTAGIWAYTFFKNMKAFSDANIIGSSPEAIFQLDYQALEPYEGEYVDAEVLKPISNLLSRRDYANGGGTPTVLTMTSRNDDGVAFRIKAGPVNLGEDTGVVSIVKNERLIQHFAEQVALEQKALIQKYLFGIARAAISNMTSSAHTLSKYSSSYSANNIMTTGNLASTRALLGDKAGQVLANGKGLWVMTPEAEADLCTGQVAANLHNVVRDVITSGSALTFSCPYITYSDTPTFTAGGTTAQGQATHYCLGLGAGFARIKVKEPKFYVVDQRTEYESVANLLRADFDFSVSVNGFGWDKSGGGANPTYSTAVTASNWVVNYSDHREVPGVLLSHNSSIAD